MATGLPGLSQEADSFLLLPHGTEHGLILLPGQLPLDHDWTPAMPLGGEQQQLLPVPHEGFLGRNLEVQLVIREITQRRRLVTISGESGVGKSSVAISALNFMADRHMFNGGAFYVDLSRCTNMDVLTTEIIDIFPPLLHAAPAIMQERRGSKSTSL